GVLSAVVVSPITAPRCQLCAAGADRDWPGDLPPSTAAESSDASGALGGATQEPARAGADSAIERRLSGGGAADELRADEPGRLRAGESRCSAEGRRVPGERSAAGRQLADRHEPGDVGDHTGGERAGRGRRPGAAGSTARTSRLARQAAIHGAASLYGRG